MKNGDISIKDVWCVWNVRNDYQRIWACLKQILICCLQSACSTRSKTLFKYFSSIQWIQFLLEQFFLCILLLVFLSFDLCTYWAQCKLFLWQMYAYDRHKCMSKFHALSWRVLYVLSAVSALLKEDTRKLCSEKL